MHKISIIVLGLFSLVFFMPLRSSAQTDQIEGLWYNAERTGKIQIYKATNNKFYGKIVWLKEPNRNGKPKLDENNSDPAKRTQPEMGLVVLDGFKKDGDILYDDGTIYDPRNGKTYSCKINYKKDHLDIRGYIGISLIGKTTIWTKAD